MAGKVKKLVKKPVKGGRAVIKLDGEVSNIGVQAVSADKCRSNITWGSGLDF